MGTTGKPGLGKSRVLFAISYSITNLVLNCIMSKQYWSPLKIKSVLKIFNYISFTKYQTSTIAL